MLGRKPEAAIPGWLKDAPNGGSHPDQQQDCSTPCSTTGGLSRDWNTDRRKKWTYLDNFIAVGLQIKFQVEHLLIQKGRQSLNKKHVHFFPWRLAVFKVAGSIF